MKGRIIGACLAVLCGSEALAGKAHPSADTWKDSRWRIESDVSLPVAMMWSEPEGDWIGVTRYALDMVWACDAQDDRKETVVRCSVEDASLSGVTWRWMGEGEGFVSPTLAESLRELTESQIVGRSFRFAVDRHGELSGLTLDAQPGRPDISLAMVRNIREMLTLTQRQLQVERMPSSPVAGEFWRADELSLLAMPQFATDRWPNGQYYEVSTGEMLQWSRPEARGRLNQWNRTVIPPMWWSGMDSPPVNANNVVHQTVRHRGDLLVRSTSEGAVALFAPNSQQRFVGKGNALARLGPVGIVEVHWETVLQPSTGTQLNLWFAENPFLHEGRALRVTADAEIELEQGRMRGPAEAGVAMGTDPAAHGEVPTR